MTASKKAIQLAKELNKAFKKSDDKRDKGLPKQLPEVERFDNLIYGNDETWHILDIYRPRQYTGKLPFIVNIHGGGWVYGTKETYQFYGMQLAKEDFAFVNITYRLPPKSSFPDELCDINQAIHWVVAHADDYDLDINNIFLVGDSAGGQMALQYLAALTNHQFGSLFPFPFPNIKVRAAAINCGAGFMYLPNAISGAIQAYFTETSISKYSDLLVTETYLTKDCPPLFIMTTNKDFCRDNALRLDGYLMAKEIAHEFHSYGTSESPREHVFHCNVRDPLAQQCNADELNFFRKYISH